MGQIGLFKDYSHFIGPVQKEKKSYEIVMQKIVNMNIQWTRFPNL